MSKRRVLNRPSQMLESTLTARTFAEAVSVKSNRRLPAAAIAPFYPPSGYSRDMGMLVLPTLLAIAVASLPVLILIWIDRVRGKRGTTSRATWWFAGVIVVWILLDSLALLIPAYRAGLAS